MSKKNEEEFTSSAVKVKKGKENLAFDIFDVTLTLIILVIIIYPLYWTVIASFSDPDMVNRGQVLLLPHGVSFFGYQRLFSYTRIWRAYVMTIYYTVLGTALNVAVTVSAGYALSRPQLPFRSIIMKFLIFTMFFNGGMIPLYLLIKNIHLLDTVWALILPTTLSVYNITVARAFFQGSIPDGIIDAAKIDGCSEVRAFFSIVLPVSPAIISVMVLFHVVFRWNEYFNALLFFSSPSKYPLQLVLRDILLNAQNAANSMSASNAKSIVEMAREAQVVKYTSMIVSTLPMLIIYPFLQKYFVKGVMVGALKG